MGFRAHVQVKHEIDYGKCTYFNHLCGDIENWLTTHNVGVCKCESDSSEYWEIYKDDLRQLGDDAFNDCEGIAKDWRESKDDVAQELREFVKEMLDAPTGDWAYVDWY